MKVNFSYTNTFTGKVILFLTDGDQTAGGEPLEVIKEENKKMNNRVVILTYGLGQRKYRPNFSITLFLMIYAKVYQKCFYNFKMKFRSEEKRSINILCFWKH